MKIRQVARAVRAIDRFAELCGVAVAWLMVPLIVAVVYEVVARYAFAAPTLWSFDVTYMLYGAIFMLGAAYAYEIAEVSEQTPWRPLLWPLKACVPLAAALLLLQGVSELAKSLYAAFTGREFKAQA
jgi:TRAP-type mannitol/chloroaromatic compound transport system permease small subunit